MLLLLPVLLPALVAGRDQEIIRTFGLLHSPNEESRETDPVAEAYLESLKGLKVPESWDARDNGWVSSIEYQRSCGSCVVFTNIALLETCIAKEGNRTAPDLSEQQALVCAYDEKTAFGCHGATPEAYLDWVVKGDGYMAEETSLPYHPHHLKFHCPATRPKNCNCPALPEDHPGVKAVGRMNFNDVDEETIKALVYTHGAAQVAVNARPHSFQHYKKGVYQGCKNNRQTNHGFVLIGWGRDAASGLDYWIAKNSWGTRWGEKGFMRIQRGVKMCGLGDMVVVVECQKVGGTTSAPVTTTTPPPPPRKEKCDLTGMFGWPLTMSGLDVSFHKSQVLVDCEAGQCFPSPPAKYRNACQAICGKATCGQSLDRSLDRVSFSLLQLRSLLTKAKEKF